LLVRNRVSSDNRFVVSSGFSGEVSVFRINPKQVWTLPRDFRDEPEECPANFNLSPDGKLVAWTYAGSSSGAKGLHVYDLETGLRKRSHPGRPRRARGIDLFFNQPGTQLLSLYGGRAECWNLAPPPQQIELEGHRDEAWCVAFSPDGRLLATGSDDTTEPWTIKIWDLASGKLLRGWKGHPATVSSLAFSPDGERLFSGSLSHKENLKVWEVETGRLVADLSGHQSGVRAICVEPRSQTLVSASDDGTIRTWSLATLQPMRTSVGHSESVRGLSLDVGGNSVVSASHDGTLRRWGLADSSESVLVDASEHLVGVVATRSGELVVAGEESQVRIYDGRTARPLRSFVVEDETLLCLSLAPDGQTLAAAGKDGIIGLWDPEIGQRLMTFPRFQAQVNGLAFSPDGNCLAAALHDGSVKVWKVTPIHRPN
jgi:WD40 repeat protein